MSFSWRAMVLAAGAAALVAVGGAVAAPGGPTASARLSGANEVPPVDTDTTGSFRIRFAKDFSSAEYELTVRDGVRVTQAHLHCGPAGVNGPVTVFLAGFHDTGWDVDGKWIGSASITDDNIVNQCSGTVVDLADLFAEMVAGNIYANVHTTANAGGEVRGQVEVPPGLAK